jgi:hypothetical protein
MEDFINLNAPSASSTDTPTIFRYRKVSDIDYKRAVTNGRIAGGVYSFLTAIVLILIGIGVPEDHPLDSNGLFWLFLVIACVGSSFWGGALRKKTFEREIKEGYIKIDQENVEYWTPGKTKTIPMDRLFGAGAEPEAPISGFRFAYLHDNERGFETIVRDFKDYQIAQNPMGLEFPPISSGNDCLSETIRAYISNRRNSGLPVAEIPPYKFKSIQHHHKNVVGKEVIDASFDSDGKTLFVLAKGSNYTIPVTDVTGIEVNKATYKGSPTKWDINILMEGKGELFFDILNITRPEEIDIYLHCVPVLFPL